MLLELAADTAVVGTEVLAAGTAAAVAEEAVGTAVAEEAVGTAAAAVGIAAALMGSPAAFPAACLRIAVASGISAAGKGSLPAPPARWISNDEMSRSKVAERRQDRRKL